MPMHDWSRLVDGEFHDFHVAWLVELRKALNGGLLPAGHYAAVELHVKGYYPDVMNLRDDLVVGDSAGSGVTVLRRPQVRPTVQAVLPNYSKDNRVVAIRKKGGARLVAVIEIVSPGNKDRRTAIDALLNKSVELLSHGVHLVLIDAIAPGRLDPHGMHALIWEELTGELLPPPTKPLGVVSYEATDLVSAYVQELAPGDAIGETPLFLTEGGCVLLPAEATYMATFDAMAYPFRDTLNAPA